jgi:hypothetical protein
LGVLVALLVVGGIFAATRGGGSESEDDDLSIGAGLPELSPEDIGMEVTVREDGRALMFELTKADDIEKVEYTIEYEAQTEEGVANQGIFGEMNIGKDGITKTDFREFGTCSAGRCRYDNVVSDITINLKVIKKDGKEYQVQEIVKIPKASDDE